MTDQQSGGLQDLALECAMAAESVFSFERYLALGAAPADYAYEHCRAVVEAAQSAWDADGSVSAGTVARELQRAGKLAGLGGQSGLAELLTSFAVPDADRLRELRRLRGVRDAAAMVAQRASQGDLHGALGLLSDAQNNAIDSSAAGEPKDAFELGCVLVESLIQDTRAQSLVHPGLPIMAEALGEIPLGSMVVLGGGTNVGKSSVTLEMLLGAAARNVTCGYVSCEDPESVLSSRLVSAKSGVSSRKLAQGTVDRDEWDAVSATTDELRSLSGVLWFSFAVGGNEIDVCASMSKLAMRGCRMIVVDYIQAIDSSKRQQDRRNEIRWLCARIKAHAQRLNVALVLVSQLSRPGKGDEFKEPNKHDLKEAGDLENSAEYVILLWREAADDFAPINVKLEKSKFGNIGSRWKMVRGKGARLSEVDGSYQSANQRRGESQ